MEQAILDKLHSLALVEDCEVIALTERGLSNDNYLIRAKSSRFFCQLFRPDPVGFVSRPVQLRLQSLLADYGISLTAVYHDPDYQFVLYHWQEQGSWQDKLRSIPNSKENAIAVLADRLAAIHQQAELAQQAKLRGVQMINWPEYISRYATRVVNHGDASEQLVAHARAYLDKPHGLSFINQTNFVLCHNDLSFDNILIQGNRVVDWEFASLGESEQDIAATIVTNELAEQEQDRLIKHYQVAANRHIDRAKMVNYVTLFEFINAAWRLTDKPS